MRSLSPVTAVFLIVLVDVLGYTLILPLLPFYAEHFGASPAVVGGLLASFAACQLISGPFLGRLSDRVGRKPLLIVSQLGTMAGFVLLAYAPNLTVVFLARILDGITAGNISLAQATISDFTPPQGRARAFSKIGIAFGVGFLIGPAVSGYLARYSYSLPILVGAGLSALSVVATIVLLPSKAPEAPLPTADAAPRRRLKIFDGASFARYFRMPALRLRLSQFFLFIMSFAMYTSGIALFASRRLTFDGALFGASQVAYLLAYGGLLGIILQGALMGRLVDRFGEERLVSCGFVSMAVGFVIISMADGLPGALFAVTFTSIGHALLRPTLTSLITQSADRREQGTVLGVNQSLQSTAQIVAPLLGGALIGAGLTTVWAIVAAAFAAAGLTAQLIRRRGAA